MPAANAVEAAQVSDLEVVAAATLVDQLLDDFLADVATWKGN